jgi:PKD repeat protein
VANQTTVSPGTTVNFTDLSSNIPTGWTWSVSPGAGWAYAGGTNANSQNPQITFNTIGQYTISLLASNAEGSDTETKTNYITVEESTGPCDAASTDCDEFIQNVTLGTINNTTGCTNYGDYTAQSTVLTKGQQYTVSVMPQAGTEVGSAYTGDEIAVWIDYNGNDNFSDAGERVGYVNVQGQFSTAFNFTVPASANTGNLRMRVRISYNGDPGGEGPIDPCGTTQWGEVEDYTVIIEEEETPNLGVTELLQENVSIYPNPATDNLSIDLSKTGLKEFSVSLMDMSGKLLLQENVVNNTKHELDLSSLSNGLYQLVINSGEGILVTKIAKN